jgi:tetratricopeptide (TPR) repeat protein
MFIMFILFILGVSMNLIRRDPWPEFCQHWGNRWRGISRPILALMLALTLLLWGPPVAVADTPISTADLQELEDVSDRARDAAQRGDFEAAEALLSALIEQVPQNPALWSNRGNVRVSQNKLNAALDDYNHAIKLAPEFPDTYLNRGTAYEALGRWDDAIADYNRVLARSADDVAAYNNRGNAKAGQGDWPGAIADYRQAIEQAPDFALARANYALALYQVQQSDKALQEMRNLVRRYPQFADMRAALTAVLWDMGKQGEAESNWVAAAGLDGRYRNLDWVSGVRRWPPRMVQALEKFLTLNS